ncbi:hypothetical protein ABZ235_39265 [Streptomyces canus]|uniref:hypothetical protein n=1 Tax=Streptomyces canus TaxID=58343 RepID=UPI0033AB4820
MALDYLGLPLVVLATDLGMQDRDTGILLLTRLRSLNRRITLVWDGGGYAGQLADWARNAPITPRGSSSGPTAHRRSHPDLA